MLWQGVRQCACALGVAALVGCASHRGSRQGVEALRVVGHSDLGGQGLNGPVAIVGRTAIVGAGITPAAGVHAHFFNPYPCPPVTVKLVDLSILTAPRVVGAIPVPAGVAAIDVDAKRVNTPLFAGDLVAIALATCNTSGNFVERGVVYYDITDPREPRYLGRYQADADSLLPDTIPPCGPPPAGNSPRCASSQHSVALVQRPDGRVLSLSTEPGASASRYPSGDLRIVDVTNPRAPVQLASYPERGRPIFSKNGCRPFSAAHGARASDDGSRAVLAYYDDGVFLLDLADPSAPSLAGKIPYAPDASVEGNAAHASLAHVGERSLVLMSEEDWIPSRATLRVDAPSSLAGAMVACEAIFTLYGAERRARLREHEHGEVRGDIVYVGRGCPSNPGSGMHAGTPSTDSYLADPVGAIVLVDRTRQATQPASTTGAGCTVAERALRAQEAGAVALVVAQTVASAPEPFSPDGDPSGVRIPVVQIGKGDADALRAAVCPVVQDDGRCASGERVSAVLADSPGEWGGLRIVDITDPAAPADIVTHRSRRAMTYPPPDLGVYAPRQSAVAGELALVAWGADGLLVLDLSLSPPVEVASFIPSDRADPTGTLPGKAHVVGVAVMEERSSETLHLLVSDLHSGLYRLELGRRLRPTTSSLP